MEVDVNDKKQGGDLIRQLATEALNQRKRDRKAAVRLFKQWVRDKDDLRSAVAEWCIDQAASAAISRDMTQERNEVLRMARAVPVVTSMVPVGADTLRPRPGCLPVASDAAVARRASAVLSYDGLLAFRLPVTGKPLGDALAWEIKDGFLIYNSQRSAFERRARFLKLIWEGLPDRELPEEKQKPLAKHMDAAQLRALDERAQIAESQVIL